MFFEVVKLFLLQRNQSMRLRSGNLAGYLKKMSQKGVIIIHNNK
jgi:hypothetical protein